MTKTPIKVSLIRTIGATKPAPIVLELPHLLDLPYDTYKIFKRWISMMRELKQTKSIENAEDFDQVTDAMVEGLLESIPSYKEAAKEHSFSMNDHMQIIVKWIGIDSEGKDEAALREALETLGK